MLDTSARLLRLLSLLQTPRNWSGAELAERLDVDVRTVRRDVDRLRTLGYPVHAARGVPGYRLGAGAKLPPLLLDDEEAVAVAVGMRVAATGGIAGIEEASLRALAKLEAVLPSRLRHRTEGLRAVTVTVQPGAAAVDADVLMGVAAAIRAREGLRLDYRSHDGRATVRRVEPHRLVHSARRWYLLAWDLDRDGWRTFRLDRLRLRVPNGPRFVPRDLPADWPGSVTRGIASGGYRYRARFTLHAPVEVVAERIAPSVGTLEAVDERTCTLHTGSNSLDELVLYVGLLGMPFEVHEPPELVDHVRVLVDRLTEAVTSRAPTAQPLRGTPPAPLS